MSVSQSTTELRFFFYTTSTKTEVTRSKKKNVLGQRSGAYVTARLSLEFQEVKKNLLLFGWEKKLIVSVGCIDANN